MVDRVIRYAATLGRHSGQIDRLAFVNIICCLIVFRHMLRVTGYALGKMELRRKRKTVRDDMEGEVWMQSQQARARAQKIGPWWKME